MQNVEIKTVKYSNAEADVLKKFFDENEKQVFSALGVKAELLEYNANGGNGNVSDTQAITVSNN